MNHIMAYSTRNTLLLLILLVISSESVCAQNLFEKFKDWAEIDISTKMKDSVRDVKQGVTLIPYPNLSFSTDMGWQLGASAELVDFAKGQYYPGYRHRAFLQFSYFTNNSHLYRFFYDSQHLIKSIRTTLDITVLPQPLFDFYGYNGYEAPLNTDVPHHFNHIKRDLGRVTLDFEGKIFKQLKWYGGLSLYRYVIDRVKVEDEKSDFTLYDLYVKNNLINETEMWGGNHLYLKAGLVFDSRDLEADPTNGMRTEAFVAYSPDIISGNNYSHVKLSFSHSAFKSLIEDKLVLATRLGYHGTIGGGRVPFYLQSNINTTFMRKVTSEGLGGVNTLRGVLTNRVVGDGITWMNLEMRHRLANIRAFNHHIYLAANPFLDFGAVVQRYRGAEMEAAGQSEYGEYIYKEQPERLHVSAGMGLKLVIDENIVFSGEIGKPFDPQDGKTWQFFFGSNFIF